MENYYVGCYWQDRREDANACARRITDCLSRLAKCDEVFEDVYAVPERKLLYHITVDAETIKPIVENGRNREDFPPFKVIANLGYGGSFVSDFRKPEQKWVMRFLCGAYPNTPGLLNSCVLRLPKMGEARERLLQLETMICMTAALINAWEPSWAVVQSSAFREIMKEKGRIPGKTLAGWMVYFASDVGKVPDDLPVHSRLELNPIGTLLILTEEPISSSRPDHITAAQTMVSGLRRAGLIPT